MRNSTPIFSKATYYCPKCHIRLPKCSNTYTIIARVQDITGTIYVDFFGESGMTLMSNMDANIAQTLLDENKLDQLEEVFDQINFREVQMMVKSYLIPSRKLR